ncbi:hypothetical protein LXL04_014785 [Taraxacum kok-saghyz]
MSASSLQGMSSMSSCSLLGRRVQAVGGRWWRRAEVTITRPVAGETATVVVVECRRLGAGGGGGLRWSETRAEVVGNHLVKKIVDGSLGENPLAAGLRNGWKLGHP